MPEKTKTEIDIWDFASAIEGVNWTALGGIAQHAVIKATEAAGNVLILTFSDDDQFEVRTIPQSFTVEK